MRRLGTLIGVLAFVASFLVGGMALADGPSGSRECHLHDDDCDGVLDEDTGMPSDDADGDGLIDEDSAGDTNGDGNPDDDLDGLVDEDVADEDGDGLVNEDPTGDALNDAGENQTDCNEAGSTNVGGIGYLYAGANGAELCGDEGSSLPIDGRATVDIQNRYIAIDGDNSNTAPANGYLRIDQAGVHCGNDTNQDSSADQSGNSSSDCG
jgi:hypothetical protein